MGDWLQLDGCEVDLRLGVVHRDGDELPLTSRERELLVYLADREGTDVSREELLTEVWGYAPTARTRAIDQIVRKLRDRIEPDRGQPRHILTVTGRGYRFEGLAPANDERYGDGFVGRSDLLAAVADTLADPGLVLLHGPPGVGKTRLAWEALRGHDGWFVALEGRATPGEAVAAVLEALGLPLVARQPIDVQVARVAQALAARDGLLVLDNLEHLALEDPLASWVQAAPRLSVLVTSQHPVPGARTLAVGGLAPDAAARLFVERARQRWAGFEADAGEVARLCDRLDHLPLAIELAAARVRVLPVVGMLERLDRQLSLLRSADGPPRRATMEGAVAWAWDLLAAPEQRALSWLSVLEGFDAAGAEALLGERALDRVDALVDCALVQPLRSGKALRLRVYEAVRAFVQARHPPPDEARERHLDHVLRLTPGLPQAEVPNARAALQWATAAAPDRAATLLVRLLHEPAWPMTMAERLDAVQRLRAAGPVGADADGLVAHEVELLRIAGRPDAAMRAARAGIDRATTAVGRHAIANMLGGVLLDLGRPDEAMAVLDGALAGADPDHDVVHTTHRVRATALRALGDRRGARAALELALANAEARGDPRDVGDAWLQLAQVAAVDDMAEAERLLDHAARAYDVAEDPQGAALVAMAKANVALEGGRLDDARAGVDRMEAHARRIDHPPWLRAAALMHAWIALDAGALEAAIDGFRDLEPEADATAALGLAVALLVAGRPDDAARWLPPVRGDGEGACLQSCLRVVALGSDADALAHAEATAEGEVDAALVRVTRSGRADPEAVALARTSLYVRQLLRMRRRSGR